MPQLTKTQSRLDSREIAKELFTLEKPYKDMYAQREALKEKLRPFGAKEYSFEGGVVTVGEPEVRTFKGQALVLNADKALQLLEKGQIERLIQQGIIERQDVYTRNAVAKVETKLT